jgi:NCS1 family nucleobase:cation symporter-1
MPEIASQAGINEVVESHTIDYIGAEERHGWARDLFAVWFVPNIAVTNVVVGVVVLSLGQSMLWSILSIVFGVVAGTVFMALHSAQGPTMGVPQMIQTRAQFGFVGSLLPVLIAIVIELGWFTVISVLTGQAITAMTGMSINASIIVSSAVVLAITIFGYDLLLQYARLLSLLTVVLFAAIVVKVFFVNDTPSITESSDSVGMFLLAAGIAASSAMTWAPFVADYSRYLPTSTSTRSAFWYTFLGCAGGAGLSMVIGVLLGLQTADGAADPVAATGDILGSGISWLVLLILILGLIQGNVLDLYSAGLSSVTALDCVGVVMERARSVRVRWGISVVSCVVLTVLAVIAAHSDFLVTYENYLLVILYLIIPWTAINLVDYYLLRHGDYAIPELFERDGVYGRTNWPALGVYAVGILAQAPFVNTTLYQGWFVDDLDGADLAWIVGLLVSGGLYYAVRRRGIGAAADQTAARERGG